MDEERFMEEALLLADRAAALEEVPVGAVVVCDGKIVGRGFNSRETDKNALYHAEIKAIDEACRTLGGWRLHKCDLYVTMEPCPMCAGAIINARIRRVIFGCRDEKAGAFGTKVDLCKGGFNHRPEIVSGVCEERCAEKLSVFFACLREKRKNSVEK